MRKISLLLIAVVAFMISCTQGTSYKINGTTENSEYNDTYAYIQEVKDREVITIDSALISDGKFTLEGDAQDIKVYYISLDPKVSGRMVSQIVLEPGQIAVKADSESITVSGTNLNNALAAHNEEISEQQESLMEITQEFQTAGQDGSLTEELRDELISKYDSINEKMNDKVKNFIKSNISNELGKTMLLNNLRNFDFETQEELIALTNDKFKEDETIKSTLERIENAKKVAIGQKFVDFTMKDLDGNNVSLSDYAGKGKVVLVDFWAAWCGPCRQEMPNVVEAYKKYKDKGFEVVGVSFDRDQESWEKGLKDLNMTWPQMSDLKYWDTPVVSLYAINGIPHTILLDGEGTIIAKDLRAEALHNKLAEILD